jgi:thiol:disulfide interchange protein DsbG
MKTDNRKEIIMRLFLLSIITFLIMPTLSHAQSQQQPSVPTALQKLVENGAQIFYLGKFENMNGWALLRKGKPEIFYENEDRTALIMGLMFNSEGDMISMSQISELRRRVGDDMYAATGNTFSAPNLDMALNTVNNAESDEKSSQPPLNRPLTKAEQMYVDLIAANWVTMNPDGQYDVFGFIDPDCPHCKEFINDIQNHTDGNAIRLRVIPIGTTESSLKKAAILLASGNPQERLIQYASGDTTALEAPENINTDGAQNNLNVMLKYGLDATPLVVYKTGKGEIRMIRGKPSDLSAIISDITQN